MEKLKVRICVGTHCYVMGNHELKDLKEQLPSDLKNKVYLESAVCLGCDKMTEKKHPPYVEIDGQLVEKAGYDAIVEKLREIIKRKNKE